MRAAQDIAAQPRLRITYAPRGDALPEAEIATLASIYSFVIGCANKNVGDKTSTNSTSVRYTEEVGDVERQPD
jgi:hypothetical protein